VIFRQPWFLLAAVLSLSSCATIGSNVQMVGTEADFIHKAGFAEDININWFTSSVYREDKKAEFSRTTEKIVWFMVFRNASFIGSAEFTAKWHSPDGQLYKEQRFTQIPGDWNIAVTDLKIAGNSAASLPGKWKIEIYYQNKLIAYRSFVLL
jgi:hypothetical protein